MNTVKIIAQNKSFGGMQYVYSHFSKTTESEMRFALYQPPEKTQGKFPCLFWLSGLTCTEQNFITKAGAQRIAAQLGIVLIVPDTSPRGVMAESEAKRYDFGEGAGFYLDATLEPWSHHYQMYTYITKELYELVLKNFSIDENRIGIFGHSMGGLGALNLAFRNPDRYKSVSAFAPICAPCQSPRAIQAYTGYLGTDKNKWQQYDPISLIKTQSWKGRPILVDQGSQDEFLENLKPDLLKEACARENIQLTLRMHDAYDHSYYFIASFIEDHLRFHLNEFN